MPETVTTPAIEDEIQDNTEVDIARTVMILAADDVAEALEYYARESESLSDELKETCLRSCFKRLENVPPAKTITLLLKTGKLVKEELRGGYIETCLKIITAQKDPYGHAKKKDPLNWGLKYLCSIDYQKAAAFMALYPTAIDSGEKEDFARRSCFLQIRAVKNSSKKTPEQALKRLLTLFDKEAARLSATVQGEIAVVPREEILAKAFYKTLFECCHLIQKNGGNATTELSGFLKKTNKAPLLHTRTERALAYYQKNMPARHALKTPKRRHAPKVG